MSAVNPNVCVEEKCHWLNVFCCFNRKCQCRCPSSTSTAPTETTVPLHDHGSSAQTVKTTTGGDTSSGSITTITYEGRGSTGSITTITYEGRGSTAEASVMTTSSGRPNSGSSANLSDGKTSRPNTGAIAGGVVATIVIIAIAAVLGFVFIRKRRKKGTKDGRGEETTGNTDCINYRGHRTDVHVYENSVCETGSKMEGNTGLINGTTVPGIPPGCEATLQRQPTAEYHHYFSVNPPVYNGYESVDVADKKEVSKPDAYNHIDAPRAETGIVRGDLQNDKGDNSWDSPISPANPQEQPDVIQSFEGFTRNDVPHTDEYDRLKAVTAQDGVRGEIVVPASKAYSQLNDVPESGAKGSNEYFVLECEGTEDEPEDLAYKKEISESYPYNHISAPRAETGTVRGYVQNKGDNSGDSSERSEHSQQKPNVIEPFAGTTENNVPHSDDYDHLKSVKPQDGVRGGNVPQNKDYSQLNDIPKSSDKNSNEYFVLESDSVEDRTTLGKKNFGRSGWGNSEPNNQPHLVSNETNEYFILENEVANNKNAASMETGEILGSENIASGNKLEDEHRGSHHYFVLENNGSKSDTTSPGLENETENHSYFVLEKKAVNGNNDNAAMPVGDGNKYSHLTQDSEVAEDCEECTELHVP